MVQGSAPFLSYWKDLKRLSKSNRTISNFMDQLEITDGTCFEIELDEEYLQSLPQNKLLKKVPTEHSEWEKMWKEMKNFTTPIEDLFGSIRSEEK